MMSLRWVVGLICLLAPVLSAAAQDPPKTPPPPLKEALVLSDREYASFAYNSDTTRLALGTDGGVRILQVASPDAVQGVEIRQLKHPGRVTEVSFEAQARIFVSRSRDQDVQIWDQEKWQPVKFAVEDRAAADFLGGAALMPKGGDSDSASLILLNQARGFRVWMLDGLKEKRRHVFQAEVRDWNGVSLGHITAVAAIDKDLLAGDDQGYLFRLPDVRSLVRKVDDGQPERLLGKLFKTAEAAHIFRPHSKEITSISMSGEAQRCLTAGRDGKVRLWNLGSVPHLIVNRGGDVPKPEWELDGRLTDLSRDGRMIAVADDDGVGVYQASSGIALSWNPVPKGRIVRLGFSPNGKFLTAIVCRCVECTPGEGVAVVRPRRRQADHAGTLVQWK
jgi:WD40 repeat protein